MNNLWLSTFDPAFFKNKRQMKQDAIDKIMGYPMEHIKELVKQAKHINRNRIVELNQRDLQQNGIEND